MPIIIISYRRSDSKDIAQSIYDGLVRRYGEKSVYIDIHSNQPSADYRLQIRQTLQRAVVMLSVIGKQWSGPRAKRHDRIFDHDDPVRVEIEAALSNSRAVMPVLVHGARMPTQAEIPATLKKLPYLHAIEIKAEDEFSFHLKRLIRAIDRLTTKFWASYLSIYLALPFALLLLCDYLILFKFDLDPLLLKSSQLPFLPRSASASAFKSAIVPS